MDLTRRHVRGSDGNVHLTPLEHTGYYREFVTVVPEVVGGFILPMEGPGLGTDLLPDVFQRADPHLRRTEL